MALTEQQKQEIKEQQSHQNTTKRVTSPELEKILYEAIPVLDHGFLRVVDYMGDDSSIVQAARVSYGKGTKKISTDSQVSKQNNTSSNTNDKIAQAKQICKDLGFKTNTEKFADCSLKMLSMQFEVQNRESSSDGGTQQNIVVNQGYSVGDAMIALSGIISDANNVRSSYGGGNCRIFQHAYRASLKCN